MRYGTAQVQGNVRTRLGTYTKVRKSDAFQGRVRDACDPSLKRGRDASQTRSVRV